ncbi:hypothetical protein BVH03_09415 [Pseudomonas sp. PA15(2017)]|uniref:DUF2523 family protein n=1 Tax=Pseudomonas sp. PA15(2017) TaxID=1932111 RepID=UPI000969A87C|nr:DUF2523 family protein [Pseudomonas sp. PA15(2017)]OLU30966.1 hypothetical protein BVH03_09415 [Pseudomonas sp. PA15(2017)]
MAGIFQFFTTILAKIVNFAKWLLAVFKQVFVDCWNIFTDLFCWGFESVLGIAVGALNMIAIPFNPQTYFALIPPDVANVMGYIGVPQGAAIVVSGLIIRFTLQTIPFVRWGS